MVYETIILIPSYNGRQLLDECLRSIRGQSYQNFKTVVADDASKDDTIEYLRVNFPEVDVLALPKNRGFARTVNAGLHYSLEKYQPSFIAVTNNDTRADGEWLAALVRRAKSAENIAAVTSNMLFYNHPEIINSQGGTLDWNGDGYDANFGLQRQFGRKKSSKVLGACWGASLISADALRKVGFLDEKFNAYFEDLDWSWRANLLGYDIFFEIDAIIYHKHSASYRGAQYKKLYLCKKNALRSAIKNYGASELPKQISYVLIGYWFAIVGYFQTSKYQITFRKKLAYVSIPFLALGWNLLRLPSTLKERRKIQQSRKRNDQFILKLAAQDTTPVRAWIEKQKSMFAPPKEPAQHIIKRPSRKYRRPNPFLEFAKHKIFFPIFNKIKHRIILPPYNLIKYRIALPLFYPVYNFTKHKIVLPIYSFAKHRIVLPLIYSFYNLVRHGIILPLLSPVYYLTKHKVILPVYNSIKHRLILPVYYFAKHRVILPLLSPVYNFAKHKAVLPVYYFAKHRIVLPLLSPVYNFAKHRVILPVFNLFKHRVILPPMNMIRRGDRLSLSERVSNLPFSLSSPADMNLLDGPGALVTEACLLCLGLSYHHFPNQFKKCGRRITAAANFLKEHEPDWQEVIEEGRRSNALSQVFFYLRAAENQMGRPIPAEVMRTLRHEGSHIQNAVLGRINPQKLVQGKPNFFVKLYSKMYLEYGLVKYLTTKIHQFYNRRAGKNGTEKPSVERQKHQREWEKAEEIREEKRGKLSGIRAARPVATRLSGIYSKRDLRNGVNIFGFLDSESGVGEAARTIVRAVDQAGIPSALLNSPRVPHRRNDNQFSRRFSNTNPYRVNLIVIYGDVFGIELKNFGEERFADKYNIAYWAWELPEMPAEWGELLDRVNEVWVSSSFVATAVKRLRPNIPVTIIPHAIDVGKHPFPRAHFELPEGHLLFLTMFDFFSIFERKNPLAVIRAFKEAFSPEESAHLVIKCSNPKVGPKDFRLLEEATREHNIHLIPHYLSREEITSLLNVCDCYVSLHRSEGFGLPLAEAMALRKPVIATNWSGNVDFMNEMNSFPIDYKLVPLKKDYGIYRQGNEWAEPDEHETARRMRLIYENHEIAARKGMAAQSEIVKKFSPTAVGRLIAKNLRRIRRGL